MNITTIILAIGLLITQVTLAVTIVRLNRLASRQAEAWNIQAEINRLLSSAITGGDK